MGRRSSWISIVVVGEAWRRFIGSFRLLPRAIRWRWGMTIAVGFVAAALLSAGLSLMGRRFLGPSTSFEQAVLASLEAQSAFPFGLAIWMEPLGSGLFFWPLVLVCAGVAAWWRRPLHALSFLLGYASLHLHVGLGWLLWDRARPELVEGGLASPGSLHSFPSGHVAQAVFVYGLLGYLWWTRSGSRGEGWLSWALMVALVSAVAAARMRLGAHWPGDVASAILVSGVWTASVAFALHRAGNVAGAGTPRSRYAD